jgi:hypothetical protein
MLLDASIAGLRGVMCRASEPGVARHMRVFATALAVAFVGSWALAERQSATTQRVVTGIVDRFDGQRLRVGAFELPISDTTRIESEQTQSPLSPSAIVKGQQVIVNYHCMPANHPGCLIEKVRVLADVVPDKPGAN